MAHTYITPSDTRIPPQPQPRPAPHQQALDRMQRAQFAACYGQEVLR